MLLKVLQGKAFSFLLQSAFPLRSSASSLPLSFFLSLSPHTFLCYGVFICYSMLDSLQGSSWGWGQSTDPHRCPMTGFARESWFQASPSCRPQDYTPCPGGEGSQSSQPEVASRAASGDCSLHTGTPLVPGSGCAEAPY